MQLRQKTPTLIIRLLIAVLTFSAGLGFDRLLTLRPNQLERATPNASYEPITAEAVIAAPMPVIPPKPTLIFDYDPDKFSPVADYAFTGKRPKGLAWDDSFFIEIWHWDESSRNYVGFSVFDERGNTDLWASFALVTERRLFFVTQPTDEGFVYRFDGEFLRRGVIFDSAEGEPVLKGKLTKSKNNRTLVEWPVKFKVIHQGC
jgi:hypothetical protein